MAGIQPKARSGNAVKKSFSTAAQFDTWIGPKDGFTAAVGNTPLIRLKSLSQETGCDILAKAEFMNPGGSVKDRAAWAIIREAEQRGIIKPGNGTVVEGTAGNTGIGMAHVCGARGYKCIIYMPNTQSQEKIDLLRALGADVRPVPAVPFDDPNNYNHQARREAERLPNAVWGNQFDNITNRQIHIDTTGPEIWEQTRGRVAAWTVASGTGGTYAGVAHYLKSKDLSVKCLLADPPGSVLYNFFKTGRLERQGTGSITEGIGQGRVTANMKVRNPPPAQLSRAADAPAQLRLQDAPVDDVIHVPDEASIKMVFRLLHEEGLYVGASSALNAAAALEAAKRLGAGNTVVTVLCDGAYRYQSRLFSRKWLESKGLLGAVPEQYHGSLTA